MKKIKSLLKTTFQIFIVVLIVLGICDSVFRIMSTEEIIKTPNKPEVAYRLYVHDNKVDTIWIYKFIK